MLTLYIYTCGDNMIAKSGKWSDMLHLPTG